jgi:hypothetical protein
LLLPAALAVAAVAAGCGASGDPGPARAHEGQRIDLTALAKRAKLRAPLATRPYTGSSCRALAGEFGDRLDSRIAGLDYDAPGFDPGRVWPLQLGELNRLFARLSKTRLDCDSLAFVATMERRLSPAFRARAYVYTPAIGEVRFAKDHAEWRAVISTMLETFARLREQQAGSEPVGRRKL